MQASNSSRDSFQKMAQIIKDLQYLAQRMLTVMDEQIEAIVANNETNIEKHTEKYTDLRGAFNNKEKDFEDHLHKLLEKAEQSPAQVRLSELKELFPDAQSVIDSWQKQLRKQSRDLKKKHERVVSLLDFALNRNIELMYSIYSLSNRMNTRYGSGGQKEEISSGIAVNKEA